MATNTDYLIDPAKFEPFIAKIEERGKPFGFDIETGYTGPDKDGTSLNPEDPAWLLAGLSFSADVSWGRYIPVGHDDGPNMPELEFAVLAWRLLATGLGIPHNATFELRCLATFFRRVLWDHPELGPAVRASNGYYPIFSDTLIELYIEAKVKSVGLKPATLDKFGYQMATLASLFPGLAKNKQKALRFNVLNPLDPAVISYACDDSIWTLAHHLKTWPEVSKQFLYQVEMGIIPIVCDMEDFGLEYDFPAMARAEVEAEEFTAKLGREIELELEAMVKQARHERDEPEPENFTVNLASPKQVGEVLFDELQMPITRRSKKTNKPSTDAIALTTLSMRYEVVRRILDWKEMRRLIDTYLAKYEKKYAYAPDGRTHPDHLIHGTITGRFAVADPPYQQTPKKYHYTLKSGEEFKLEFRNFIVAPKGHYILGYDYSQIELRIMAGESQEPTLLAAFEKAEDVHSATASLMLNVPKDEVTKDQRAIGKTMNFALIYGMGAKSLGERLGIDKLSAEKLYDQYFAAYSAIKVWSDRQLQEGKRYGYTKSRMGRRHTIWELQSDDSWIYSKGERLCVNAPIQGGAADYMKVAMIRAVAALKKAGLYDRVHLVMNIHDALEFYVEDSVSPQEVIDVLAPAVTYRVEGMPPIVADWHLGRSWGTVHDIELDEDGTILGNASPDAQEPVSAPEKSATEVDDLEASESVRGAVKASLKDLAPESAGDAFAEVKSALNVVPWEPGMDYDFNGDVIFDASLPHPRLESSDGSCVHCGLARSPMHARARDMEAEAGAQSLRQESKTLHVRLTRMPTLQQYQAFTELLKSKPGRNKVVLETPEGVMEMTTETGVDLGNQGEVSLALGGAEVFYPADEVSVESITAGMDL